MDSTLTLYTPSAVIHDREWTKAALRYVIADLNPARIILTDITEINLIAAGVTWQMKRTYDALLSNKPQNYGDLKALHEWFIENAGKSREVDDPVLQAVDISDTIVLFSEPDIEIPSALQSKKIYCVDHAHHKIVGNLETK